MGKKKEVGGKQKKENREYLPTLEKGWRADSLHWALASKGKRPTYRKKGILETSFTTKHVQRAGLPKVRILPGMWGLQGEVGGESIAG